MRGRFFNWRAIGRVALYAALAIAGVATAIDLAIGYTRTYSRGVAAHPTSGARAQQLLRCQALGLAAERDAACQAAWAENRRRFLTYRSGMARPSSSWSSIRHEDHA